MCRILHLNTTLKNKNKYFAGTRTISIFWNHQQASPISWDYPFNVRIRTIQHHRWTGNAMQGFEAVFPCGVNKKCLVLSLFFVYFLTMMQPEDGFLNNNKIFRRSNMKMYECTLYSSRESQWSASLCWNRSRISVHFWLWLLCRFHRYVEIVRTCNKKV
jgi:hypothetical protein